MKNQSLLTYRDHLNFITAQPQSNGWDYSRYVQESQMHHSFSELSSTLIFLLDFATQSYPVMGANTLQVMGHQREAFTEGGLEFMLSNYKDFDILNKKIFPDQVKLMEDYKSENISSFRFSKSYRFQNHQGRYNTILQRNSLLSVKNNPLPIAIFGCAWDITNLTEKGKVIHQIEKYDTETGQWILLLSKEYYPDIDQNQLLSKREIEILKWSVEGCSSKQIAEKLYITFNTVNTHRRNMLRKTNCRNSMELLRYAVENKLL